MITNLGSKNGPDGDRFDYVGLSTDDKPTACGVNSLFFELDTGDCYYYTGESWTKEGA